MEGYFQADRGSCTTMQNGHAAMPPIELNRPELARQFADQMEQVLGDDSEPDPLFFVESWTIGVPAAVQNLQLRRQRQQDQQRQSHVFNRFHNLRTLSFIQERGIDTEFLSSFGATGTADSYVAGLPPQSDEMPAVTAQSRLSQESGAVFEEFDRIKEATSPLTLQGARRLLAVTTTSTREQIRAAYRRMASSYHPDRLVSGTETERQLGTDRMAAINEAYRLLST
jgi:hypothetical protein